MLWGLKKRSGRPASRESGGDNAAARLQGRKARRPELPYSPNFSLLMPQGPLISVVLPVYNQASLLGESIESVLQEREIPLELIVIDDGSTDNPEEIAAKYREEDQRIRFVTRKNGGVAAALNTGFALAGAPFLTWTSADNRFLAGGLKALLLDQLAHSRASLSYGNVRIVDEQGLPAHKSSYRPSDQAPDDPSVLHLPRSGELLFCFDDNFVNAAFLYRREFALAAGEYGLNLNGYEDYDYWLRISAFAPVRHIKSADPLYEYRLHENSLTGRLDAAPLAHKTRERRLRIAKLRSEILGNPVDHTQFERTTRPEDLLLRARDSCFGAVLAPGEIVGIVTGGPPPALLGELAGSGKTIAAFLTSATVAEAWKDAAAKLNCVVVSDFPESFGELGEAEYRLRSLMFFLSSVDSLLYCLDGASSANELRGQALNAAYAGLTLRCLKDPKIKGFTALSDVHDAPPGAIPDKFLPAPHVEFFDSAKRLLSGAPPPFIAAEVLDEWILAHHAGHRTTLELTRALRAGLENLVPFEQRR